MTTNPPEMKMVALPRKHTAARLNDIETELEAMRTVVDRGRRQRKLIFIAIAGLCVGLLLAGGLIIYLLAGRADSRRYYNNQLHQIVCAVPPGDETRDLLRERANCGPYTRPSGQPSKSSAPRADALPTSPTSPISTASTAPARADAPSVTSVPERSSGSRATRTVTAPDRPPRLAPSSRPAVNAGGPTPTASAPSATTGLLPALLCTVLGCIPDP